MQPPQPPAGASTVEAELTALLRRHNPSKVADVPRLLANYAGREQELLADVRRKYTPQEWHSPSGDKQDRAQLVEEISAVLLKMKSAPPQEKVPTVAKNLEAVLYRCSASKADYLDLDSLERRIMVLVHKAKVNRPSLTLSNLAHATAAQQKQMIGERLYPLIHASQPQLAGKITGMLLEECKTGELLHLIASPEALRAKIQDALKVLGPDWLERASNAKRAQAEAQRQLQQSQQAQRQHDTSLLTERAADGVALDRVCAAGAPERPRGHI